MNVYVLIINNGKEYSEDFGEDVCGVFSSLELAKKEEIPEGWEFDHIEIWSLDGGYVGWYINDEEESEKKNG